MGGRGIVIRGGYDLQDKEYAVLRHHLQLTAEQVGKLGVLRITQADMNGYVHVNGQQVGEFAGWQALGNAEFRHDISKYLKPGDNVVAVVVSHYRIRSQQPSEVKIRVNGESKMIKSDKL